MARRSPLPCRWTRRRHVALLAAAAAALLLNAGAASAATISGQVTSGATGLADICVAAFDANQGDWMPAVAEVTTNAVGQYVLTVSPGQYKVGFRHCPLSGSRTWVPEFYDDEPQRWSADVVDVTGTNAAGINAGLVQGYSVAGRVTSDGTTGIQNVCVQAYVSTNQAIVYGGGSTDANGDYATEPLPPGMYKLRFSDCSPAPAYAPEWFSDKTSFQTANPIDLTLHGATGVNAILSAGYAISGRVTSNGVDAIAGICVNVNDGLGNWVGGRMTNPDGTYETEPLAPGQYRVQFSDCVPPATWLGEWYDDKPDFGAATPIAITASPVTGIDAQLAAGRVISGTVTDGSAGVSGLCVNANDATQPNPSPSPYGTATGPGGSYTLAVPPGQYKVSFQDCRPSPALVGEWWDDKPDFQSATTIDVRTADATADAALAAGRTISGRVTIEGTSTGIQGACIGVNSAAPPLDMPEGWANTQADGTFVTSPVPAGSYKLFISHCGPDPQYIGEWFDGKPDFETATPIDLSTGNATGLQIALAPGLTISGTVTSTIGASLPNVCVGVWPADTVDPGNEPGAGGTMTGADGSYRVGPLPPGSYRVQFMDCQGNTYFNEWYSESPEYAGSALVDVTSTSATGIDGTLTAGKTISGRVTSDGTNGLENICLNGWAPGDDPDGMPSAGANTDANGDFTIGPLQDTVYRLSFNDCNEPPSYVGEWYDDAPDETSATPIDVSSGNVTGLDVRLSQGRTISGTAETAGGQPIGNVCVGVFGTDGETWIGGGSTDVDGTYTTQPLPPGQYKVHFGDCNDNPTHVGEWFDDAPSSEQAAIVDVTAANATGIDAQLAHGHTISGIVKNEGGEPIESVCVNLTSTDEGFEVNSGGGWTGPDGTYVTEPAPPGQYKLEFEDCGDAPTYVREWFDDKPDWASATVVDITPDSVTGLVTVLQAGHVVSGTVTAQATGLPIENVCVGAVKATDQEAWFQGGQTDATGHYRSEPLPPGSYKVQVSDCNDPVLYVTEWFDNATSFDTAVALDLTSGNAVANAQLARGGGIMGTVRAGTAASPGAPIMGICAEASMPNGPQVDSQAGTGSDGTYRLGGLPTGTYTVAFYDCRDNQSAGTYRFRQVEGVAVTSPDDTAGVNAFMGELDNVWPDSFITSGPIGTTDRTTATFTVAGDEPGGFECTLDGQYPEAGSWCETGTATFSGLAPGDHTLQVWAWDEAGHRDETPAIRTWTVVSSPLTTHTTKGTLPPAGGTVTDDPLGAGATSSDPLTAAVTAPGPGDVTITSQPAGGAPPAGFSFFGRQVTLTATATVTANDPFRIVLTADASLVPAGTELGSIAVFRNGTPLPDCTGAAAADPDPCIVERESLAGGDIRVEVLSSTLSTWNVGLVMTPATPGRPAATPAITTTTVAITWPPAAGAVTYALEYRDANDAAWTPLSQSLGSPSHPWNQPAEGTLTFRVRATGPGGSSAWSAVSEPVIVDRTAPNPPTATTDRAPEDPNSWFLNTATVFWAAAGDPAPDGQGSGVDPASLPGAQTFVTTAPHTALGSVRDRAGNQSAATKLAVKVDADAPQVSISCPAGVAQGTTAAAHWSAVDLGSGLVTPASGDMPLDTTAAGARTATAPIARDAVGHAPVAVSCSYTVVAQPVPPAPTPTIVTTRATATSKGIVAIKVACAGATCTGTLTVRATVKVGGRKKTLKLGSKEFSVAPGRTSTVKLRLSKTNLKILKRVRKVRSTATIRLAGATGTQAKAVVTISARR
jgi:hypothetical protein